MVHLVMGASVESELGGVPYGEGVFRNGIVYRLQNRVLRLLEPDVVVGNQPAGRRDRFGR